MPEDKFIAEAEKAELDAHRAARAANLFDVRRFIGGLFLIYGVILFVLGIGASDADVEKAAGVNVNLWTGLAMLLVGAIFLAWALWRPLGEELEEAESEPAGGGARGRLTRDPSGGGTPGGNSASTEPPKPPPTIRAPAAPARLERLDRALDLGHGRLVVVAQARVRLVSRRADALEVARGERGGRRVDARVLAQHVAHAPVQRVGQPVGRRRVAQAGDAERLAGRGALRAALVVAAARVLVRRRPSRASRAASRRARAGRARSRGRGSRSAARAPSRPHSTASWSSSPVRAPTWSFSTREQSFASSTRSTSGSSSSARHSAASSAAEEDRPEPWGRSPSIVSRHGRTAWPAARSSATVPRTNARQPLAAFVVAERERVVLAEVERVRLDPVAVAAARP